MSTSRRNFLKGVGLLFGGVATAVGLPRVAKATTPVPAQAGKQAGKQDGKQPGKQAGKQDGKQPVFTQEEINAMVRKDLEAAKSAGWGYLTDTGKCEHLGEFYNEKLGLPYKRDDQTAEIEMRATEMWAAENLKIMEENMIVYSMVTRDFKDAPRQQAEDRVSVRRECNDVPSETTAALAIGFDDDQIVKARAARLEREAKL